MIAQRLGVAPALVRRMLRQDDGLKEAYDSQVDAILELVERIGVNKNLIAQFCGVSRSVVAGWFAEDPRLRSADLDHYEKLMDIAEYGLHVALQAQQRWAIERMLDSKMGAQRGFGRNFAVDLTLESQKLGVNLHSVVQEVANLLVAQQTLVDEEQPEVGERLLGVNDLDAGGVGKLDG